MGKGILYHPRPVKLGLVDGLKLTQLLPVSFHKKAVCYLLVKFLKPIVLYLIKEVPWEVDSIVNPAAGG